MKLRDLIFFIMGAGVVTLSACTHVIPKWDGKLYVMWPAKDAIARTQDPVEPYISCQDPKVHGYVCMSGKDFQSFTETYVLGCKEWRDGIPMQAVTIRQPNNR